MTIAGAIEFVLCSGYPKTSSGRSALASGRIGAWCCRRTGGWPRSCERGRPNADPAAPEPILALLRSRARRRAAGENSLDDLLNV